MSAAPLLEARGAGYAYRRKEVLGDINLTLYPGELMGVIGPNGSGKSTLLGLLAGLLIPTKGQIILDGREIGRYPRPQVARLLGLVPQATELAPGFSVLETVLAGRFALMGRRFFEDAADLAAARQALALTDALHLAERPAGALSGGERQRVILARALAAGPQALLLDEPTSALDPRRQLTLMGLLENMCAREGLAVCLVSHDLNLAALFCHRLLLLVEGRILAQGEPGEVLTPDLLAQVYGIDALIDREPARGRPRVTMLPLPATAAG